MCGISGHAGIHPSRRKLLTIGLAMGIQKRGSHAAGYLSIDKNGTLERGRTDKAWMEDPKWSNRCADQGQTVMMHARHATCRNKGVEDAHPFEIKRNDKTVLWGMHNGVIYNADESAKAHGRELTVDSRELLELMADNEEEKIRKLTGYGVVAWIRAEKPHRMFMARMTASADMCMARVKDPTMSPVDGTEYNGTIFASTREILKYASALAGVELAEEPFELKNHVVYYVDHDGGAFMLDDLKIEIDHRAKGSVTHDYSWLERGNAHTGYYAGYHQKTKEEREAEEKETADRVSAWWAAGEAGRELYRKQSEEWLKGQDITAPLVPPPVEALDALREARCEMCGMLYWVYASVCASCGEPTPFRRTGSPAPDDSAIQQTQEQYDKELAEERKALDAVLKEDWEELGLQTDRVLAM